MALALKALVILLSYWGASAFPNFGRTFGAAHDQYVPGSARHVLPVRQAITNPLRQAISGLNGSFRLNGTQPAVRKNVGLRGGACSSDATNPVVIGSLGDSGSRAIAVLVHKAGVFMVTGGKRCIMENPSLKGACNPKLVQGHESCGDPSWDYHFNFGIEDYLANFDVDENTCTLGNSEWVTDTIFSVKRALEAAATRFKRCGCKFPRYGVKKGTSMHILPILKQVAPSMTFIHLVRDGRDIMLSKTTHITKYTPAVLGTENTQAFIRRAENLLFCHKGVSPPSCQSCYVDNCKPIAFGAHAGAADRADRRFIACVEECSRHGTYSGVSEGRAGGALSGDDYDLDSLAVSETIFENAALGKVWAELHRRVIECGQGSLGMGSQYALIRIEDFVTEDHEKRKASILSLLAHTGVPVPSASTMEDLVGVFEIPINAGEEYQSHYGRWRQDPHAREFELGAWPVLEVFNYDLSPKLQP
eukprot:jgi/Mesvir1/25531/Mv01778-RA.1